MGCALIHDIPPAGEIVERICREAERLIRAQAAGFGHLQDRRERREMKAMRDQFLECVPTLRRDDQPVSATALIKYAYSSNPNEYESRSWVPRPGQGRSP